MAGSTNAILLCFLLHARSSLQDLQKLSIKLHCNAPNICIKSPSVGVLRSSMETYNHKKRVTTIVQTGKVRALNSGRSSFVFGPTALNLPLSFSNRLNMVCTILPMQLQCGCGQMTARERWRRMMMDEDGWMDGCRKVRAGGMDKKEFWKRWMRILLGGGLGSNFTEPDLLTHHHFI